MAAHASRRALDRAGLKSDDIDIVILANWTERRYIPEHAPRLLHLLNARKAVGWDVSCACAGFLYGLGIAHGFLQNPRFSRALVCAAERTRPTRAPRQQGRVDPRGCGRSLCAQQQIGDPRVPRRL